MKTAVLWWVLLGGTESAISVVSAVDPDSRTQRSSMNWMSTRTAFLQFSTGENHGNLSP